MRQSQWEEEQEKRAEVRDARRAEDTKQVQGLVKSRNRDPYWWKAYSTAAGYKPRPEWLKGGIGRNVSSADEAALYHGAMVAQQKNLAKSREISDINRRQERLQAEADAAMSAVAEQERKRFGERHSAAREAQVLQKANRLRQSSFSRSRIPRRM